MTNSNQFILTNINGGREITFKFEEEMLYDVLAQFKEFLRGCGYYFDGELEIVDPEVNPEDVYTGCGADCGHICTEGQLDLFNSLDEEPVVLWDEQEPDFPPINLHLQVDTEGGLE